MLRLFNMGLFLAFFLSVFGMPQAEACSPPMGGVRMPSYGENLAGAERVFLGTIESKTIEKWDIRLQVKIEKTWKGPSEKEAIVLANNGSTCDGFGASTQKGLVCLFFLDDKGRAVSGQGSGESSRCESNGAKKPQDLIAEYEKNKSRYC